MCDREAEALRPLLVRGGDELGASQLAFVRWIITPEAEREHKSQRELASVLGVHVNTLSRWRHDPRITGAAVALAKSYGMKMWFHCCGTFRPVMADLIDMGMDVWETVQVHLPGNEPEVLKREYGRDITFYGGINSQQTLPFASTEEVRAEVRERIRVLGQGGGYILGGDHTILPDVPIDNVLAMLDEARKYSPPTN